MQFSLVAPFLLFKFKIKQLALLSYHKYKNILFSLVLSLSLSIICAPSLAPEDIGRVLSVSVILRVIKFQFNNHLLVKCIFNAGLEAEDTNPQEKNSNPSRSP